MGSTQKHPVEYFDETLDINSTENYDLSVEVSEEGVSLAVLDLLRGKYVMLRHYSLTKEESINTGIFRDIITGDDFLRKSYRRLVVITPSCESTMVPSPLFDPGIKDDYFRFSLPSPDGVSIFSGALPFPGATVVFAPQKNISETVLTSWPGVVPWHHTKPLLYHAYTSSRSSEERYLHLHVEKSFITLIIIDKRKLLYCNSFKCASPADAGYFIFSLFDKASVKNEEDLHISGIIEPYGEMHLSLLNFTENVRFAAPQLRHSLSYVMNELPMHRWLNLFTALSCE